VSARRNGSLQVFAPFFSRAPRNEDVVGRALAGAVEPVDEQSPLGASTIIDAWLCQ